MTKTTVEHFTDCLDTVVNTALETGKFRPAAITRVVRGHVDPGLNGTQQREQFYHNVEEALQQLEYLKTFADVFQNGQMGAIERSYARLEKQKEQLAAILGYRTKEKGKKYKAETKRDVHKARFGQRGTMEMYR